jgi:hypothetical protein
MVPEAFSMTGAGWRARLHAVHATMYVIIVTQTHLKSQQGNRFVSSAFHPTICYNHGQETESK